MSALAITLAAFGLILVLARFRVPLGAAIVAGAVLLGAMFRMPAGSIAATALGGVTRPMSLGLLVTVTLLLAISRAMQETGQSERIVSLARAFLRRPAVTMAALPALIGLLPMPGGALFSAPMVHQAAGDGKVGGDLMSAVNYWWRHIWEHFWPLYPGVILAMSLTQSDALTFAAWQAPLALCMAASGLLLLRRMHPDLHAVHEPAPAGTKLKLLHATLPIWAILVVWLILAGAAWAIWGPPIRPPGPGEPALSSREQAVKALRDFVPLVGGLVASLLWTVRAGRLPARSAVRLVLDKSMLPLVGLVVSVMVFQAMLEESRAAERIGGELQTWHVPATLVVVLLPFIAGMVTGLAFGFVGVSFPIVLELVRNLPDHPAVRPYAVLAYGCGHLGMMISPIHLCYVVSNRYFKTTFGPVYRYILPPCAAMAVLLAGYFLLLRLVAG